MVETGLNSGRKFRMRRTVVEGRYVRRWHQTKAAIEGEQGLLVVQTRRLTEASSGPLKPTLSKQAWAKPPEGGGVTRKLAR